MKRIHIFLTFCFIIIYSFFVFSSSPDVELDVANQLAVASVFFFALFSGFFISRQNDRYNKIIDVIAERDGLYSFFYRVFGMLPRVQAQMSRLIRDHYSKISDSANWAYNEFNPSTTISSMSKLMSSLTQDEKSQIAGYSPFDGIWQQILQLQQNRKKIIALSNLKLITFQWFIIYLFAALVIFTFLLLPSETMLVSFLKIIFGTSVFMVILLLKQLDNLSIFGKNFSKNVADDVIRILDESDEKEISGKNS